MRRFGNRRLSKFSRLLLIGIVILLIASSILILRSNLFIVKKVTVILDTVNCSDAQSIKNSSGILGQNLIFIDFSKIINNLKNQFICIDRIDFSKQFPNQVEVHIINRQALGKLISLSSEATASSNLENISTPSAQPNSEGYLVDKDGVVFAKDLEQINVPYIFIKDLQISLGTKLESSITNSLKVLERVKIFNLNFSSIIISGNNLIIFPQIENPKVIFRLDSNINTQLASLQLILEKAKIDERIMEFIDLRFDKPIVRFAPKKT